MQPSLHLGSKAQPPCGVWLAAGVPPGWPPPPLSLVLIPQGPEERLRWGSEESVQPRLISRLVLLLEQEKEKWGWRGRERMRAVQGSEPGVWAQRPLSAAGLCGDRRHRHGEEAGPTAVDCLPGGHEAPGRGSPDHPGSAQVWRPQSLSRHSRGGGAGLTAARDRAVIEQWWARLVPGEQASWDRGGTCSPGSALKAPSLFTKISAFLKSFETSPGLRAARLSCSDFLGGLRRCGGRRERGVYLREIRCPFDQRPRHLCAETPSSLIV